MSRVALAILLLLSTASTTLAQSTREVAYNNRAIVPVNTKVRFTTVIVLPEGEEILDFVCGDKDLWVVSGTQNLAYIKPGKAGASTNLNLITASGRIYSFLLTEGATEPDLKIYVTVESGFNSAGVSRLYSAGQIEALRRDAEDARRETQEAKASAARAAEALAASKTSATESATAAAELEVKTFRSTYPTRLQFPYRFKANNRPFLVTAIFNDGQFTYIRSDAKELPSLYEIRDGKPSLVSFQVEQGTYIVPKVLDHGYLVIGKQKFSFDRVR